MSQYKTSLLIAGTLVAALVVYKSGSDIYGAIKEQVAESDAASAQVETSSTSANPVELPSQAPAAPSAFKRSNIPICDMSPEKASKFDYQAATRKQPTIKFGTFDNDPSSLTDQYPRLEHILLCPYGDQIVLFTEQKYEDAAHVMVGGLIVTKYSPATGKILARYEHGGMGWGAPPDWELARKQDDLILKINIGFTNQGCTWSRVTEHSLKNNALLSEKEDETCDLGDE